MRYKPIRCEASVAIYNKKDCAYHAVLGWSKTEWHTHRKGQLIYGEQGIIRVYTRNSVYYIPSGHVLWIPAGTEHKVLTEAVNLHFRTLYLDHRPLRDPFYKSVQLFFADPVLREMILYTQKFDLVTPASVHEKSFFTAVKSMLPEFKSTVNYLRLPVTEHPLVLKMMDFVREHMEEKHKAPEVAQQFGVSDRTMLRLFRKELKVSYSQFLKQARIIKAVELLARPGKNVSDVAYAVGYDSVPTFSNSFFAIMGVRPNAFLHR